MARWLLVLSVWFGGSVLMSGCVALPPSSAGKTDCAGEPTLPISAAVLVRTLRRNHFTVYADPSDVVCSSSDPVAPSDPEEDMPLSVTNVLFDGPHENIASHDEITKREGHVICGARRGPIWGPKLNKEFDAPPDSPIFSGEKALFKVANIECTIYPDGSRSGTQVRNLDRAMEEIERLSHG